MRNFAIASILLLAFAGLCTVLHANSIAVGVSPDSAIYITSAQSLLRGDGLSIPTGIDSPSPMTHFAPLYPTLLGLLGTTGLDLNSLAKGLNAILFFSTLLLTGFVVLQNGQKFWLLAPSASLFLLVSEDMLTIHSYAWSEPLFISLSILGCYLFGHYLWKPSSLKLAASIGLLSLAFLTRYAGVAVLPTIFLGVLLFQQDRPQKRVLRSVGLSLACAIPSLLWFIRNYILSSNLSDRNLVYHPLASHDYRNGLDTVSNWILPGRITGDLRDYLVILFLGAATILIGYGLFKIRVRAQEQKAWKLGQILPFLFAIFSLSYLLMLVFTILFVDAQSTFEYRLLSPLLISGTILTFFILPGNFKKIPWPVQLILGLFFLLVVGFNMVHSLKFVSKAHNGSFKMYAGKGWLEADIIQHVRDMPEGASIYSNGDEAINYIVGRPAARFPQKSDPFSSQVNPNYRQEIEQMQEILQERDGFIVCFSGMTWRGYLPDCEELEAILPLKIHWAGDEGWIYTLGSE
jgi:4-amino-4-deoxy-L-arabinose transferase-like glycosyltransferase